jgi:hypothetical protein
LADYDGQKALRQKDGHSCGPIVIRCARRRILGRSVASGTEEEYNPEELRAEAVDILCSAWASDVLMVGPEKKRKVKVGAWGKGGNDFNNT